MEYAQSEVTKMLNTLQSEDFYNEYFDSYEQMVGNYYRLQNRYYSIPPFVFFFNPTIQLKKIMRYDGYYVGYQIKSNYGYEVNIDFKSYFKQNNEFCAINNNRL